MIAVRRVVAGLVLVCVSGLSLAQTTTTTTTSAPSVSGVICPDAKIWGSFLINSICWSCMFPMRVFKVQVGTGDIPEGADKNLICGCKDALNAEHPGTILSEWAPARMVELVRKPYCSPTLSGTIMMDGPLLQGTRGGGVTGEDSTHSGSFYNYHYWSFPLYIMLDLLVDPNCNAGGYNSMDLMYLSEMDPTWNEDELAFFTNPEVAAVANPLAIAACAADCVMTATGQPIDKMFWCAGCWGGMYPFTGNVDSAASPPRETSLLAARVLAALHRRGLAHKTYGSGNLCGGAIAPIIPKQQYKMSMLFPIAESSGTCCHRVGQSTFTWGEWRNIPGVGEDFVYLIWRWSDCCLPLM